MQTAGSGALAGLVAAVPMAATMAAFHHAVEPERRRLPFEEVARNIAKKTGLYWKLDARERDSLSWLSHLGFGAAMGLLFAGLTRKSESAMASKGVLFGLGVWAANYLAALPAAGIVPPVTKEEKPHVAQEIVGHIVWGAALGFLSSRIQLQAAKKV